jgi:glycolate oxidase
MEKRAFLPDMFSPADIAMMRRIRHACDPDEISNPGKMFPDSEAPALRQHGLHPLEKAGVACRE